MTHDDVRGFCAIPNAVIRDRELTPATKVLYGVILSYSWAAGQPCMASTDTLCAEAGIGTTAFHDGKRALVARGWLKVEKRRTGSGWTNVYVPVARGVEVPADLREEGSTDSGQPSEGVDRQAANPPGGVDRDAVDPRYMKTKYPEEDTPPVSPPAGGAPAGDLPDPTITPRPLEGDQIEACLLLL